jgi:hypothetical protein
MENAEKSPAMVLYEMVRGKDPNTASYASGRLAERGLPPKIVEYTARELVEALGMAPLEKADDVCSELLDKAYRNALSEGSYDAITADDAYDWWRNETGNIMGATKALAEIAIETLPNLRHVGGNADLCPDYAGCLNAFERARASKWRLGVNLSRQEPWELTLKRANEAFRNLYSPQVIRYGAGLIEYWLRKMPQIFITEEGYQTFKNNTKALDIVSEHAIGCEETDPPEAQESYTRLNDILDRFEGDVERIRSAANRPEKT